MSTSAEFAQYICEQLENGGEFSLRKMFGEYAVYWNGKVVALLCDNQVFVKKTPQTQQLFTGLPKGAPYPGAKSHFLVENLENRSFLRRLLQNHRAELARAA